MPICFTFIFLDGTFDPALPPKESSYPPSLPTRNIEWKAGGLRNIFIAGHLATFSGSYCFLGA